MKRLRITIPVKIALLVFTTVLVSVLAFATFIFYKVKQEQQKSFSNTVTNLGLVMGKQLWDIQENTKKDMTNILAMINTSYASKNVDPIRVILQKNPHLLYFELAQIKSADVKHKEIFSLFNENAFLDKSTERTEVSKQIERDIDDFAKRKEIEVNYHFRSRPDQFPVYIFELDVRKGLYAAFALSKNVFFQIHNSSSPTDVILLNGNLETLFASDAAKSFPIDAFIKLISSHPSIQGFSERFRQGPDQKEYATHVFRAADGLILITYKDLVSAGLEPNSFIRDVLFFCAAISAVMLLMSLGFSQGLSLRIKKLMGLTENIVAGNYNFTSESRARDEVGDLAAQFRILGERLGEKDSHMEKVTEMANRDGLTGVYNRRFFRESLEELFQSSKDQNRPLSLILLDIDHYKRFNDEYGHQQGDIVIQQLAHLLLTLTRKSDLVARYGGDEFAVILVNTNLSVAEHIAERIRDAFQTKRISRLSGEGSLSGTCSLGVATTQGQNFANADALVAAADDNLYMAKKKGRNQVYSKPQEI